MSNPYPSWKKEIPTLEFRIPKLVSPKKQKKPCPIQGGWNDGKIKENLNSSMNGDE